MSRQLIAFGEALKDYAEGREPEMYRGEHVKKLALSIAETAPVGSSVESWGRWASNRMVADQLEDLRLFGCEFDTWSRESDLHTPGNKYFRALCVSGKIYKESKNGVPMCDMCAFELPVVDGGEPHPCAFCTGRMPNRDHIVFGARLAQTDPALHPDNDRTELT